MIFSRIVHLNSKAKAEELTRIVLEDGKATIPSGWEWLKNIVDVEPSDGYEFMLELPQKLRGDMLWATEIQEAE